MLPQILSHTPPWVWVILGFLVYRGILASQDREQNLRTVVVLPLVMLALSLQGMLSNFGANLPGMLAWTTALLAGAALSWRAAHRQNVCMLSEQGRVFCRGSWTPLMLMLAIFVLKYCVNVALVVQSAWRSDIGFLLASCSLFGLFSGLFLGQMLRVLHLARSRAAVTA